MKVTYDEDVDAAYIYLKSDTTNLKTARTYTCNPTELEGAQINLDFDDNFVLQGIEVMNASKHLPKELLKEK